MKIVVFFIGMLCANCAFSQGLRDTTIHLKEAVKIEKAVTKITYTIIPPVNDFVRIENENKGVTDFLKKSESFFIKNYGQGALASIAYRGTSAAQNEVYWNGIKINSPFTGQVDGNLLLVDPNQSIYASSLSNAIGAKIMMKDDFYNEQEKGVSGNFLVRYTTLNSVDLNGSVNYKGKHFYEYANASTIYAKNNFLIPNVYAKDAWKHQTHNALSMTNVKATLGYKINDKHDIFASFWWSRNNREIAPLLTQTQPSLQTQYDKSVRALMNYDGQVKNFSFILRTSALADLLNYRDEAISLNSHSQSFVSRNEVILNYFFDRIHTTTQVAAKYDYEYAVTDTSGFANPQHRNIAETREYISYQKGYFKSYQVIGTAYQTIYQKKVIPTFNFSAVYDEKSKNGLWHNVQLTAARTLRIPSMNDLYWAVGGNPNLKPEKGWKGDVKWQMQYKYFQTKLTVYGQYTTNWILWTPSSNPNVWSPENLKRVYGCGTEIFASAGLFEKKSLFSDEAIKVKRKWFAYIVSSYSYNRTINIDAISPTDASAGKQLIYVPVHKAYAAVRGGWRGISASIDYTLYSKIYTSTDNSQSLHGYGLMDLHLSYEFDVKGQKIKPSFGIYNLLNTQYQTMPNRAMPGRYYEVLVRFNLHG